MVIRTWLLRLIGRDNFPGPDGAFDRCGRAVDFGQHWIWEKARELYWSTEAGSSTGIAQPKVPDDVEHQRGGQDGRGQDDR